MIGEMIPRGSLGDAHTNGTRRLRQSAKQIFIRPIVSNAQDEFRGSWPQPFNGRRALVDARVSDLDDFIAFEHLDIDVPRVTGKVINQFLRALGSLFSVRLAIMPCKREFFLFQQRARQPVHVQLQDGPDAVLPFDGRGLQTTPFFPFVPQPDSVFGNQ